ncbi:MAG: hypothetical protein ACRBDI_09460 [Alphaproteobacteria bacterium]
MSTLFLCVSTFNISGCITSDHSAPLAPSPPDRVFLSQNIIEQNKQAVSQYDGDAVSDNSHLSPMLQNLMAQGVVSNQGGLGDGDSSVSEALGLKKVEKTEYKCRLKDRFDRKAVIAYEWDRSRLSMDVDGINMSGDGEYGARLEYKLRFQPEKRPKELCRYASSWQGMIGSGYNEFFVREDGRVLEEIKTEIKGFKQKISSVTGRIF